MVRLKFYLKFYYIADLMLNFVVFYFVCFHNKVGPINKEGLTLL